MLSHREYYALQDVQQTGTRLWAINLATMVNLQLTSDAEPFLADDFLGEGNRKQREGEKRRSQVIAAQLNRQLAMVRQLKPGEKEPDDLPKWARKDFMAQPEPVRHRQLHAANKKKNFDYSFDDLVRRLGDSQEVLLPNVPADKVDQLSDKLRRAGGLIGVAVTIDYDAEKSVLYARTDAGERLNG